MNAYIQKIRATVAALERDPRITVEECTIAAPAAPNLIDTFEMISGIYLPEPIRSFYAAANGVTVTWRLARGLDDATMARLRGEGEQQDYDHERPLGSLRILPVEKMLMNGYWKPYTGNEPLEFAGAEHTMAALGARLRAFDVFHPNNDWEITAFLTDPSGGPIRVLLLRQHAADYRSSRLTDFDTYLRAMIATRFTVPSRARLFGEYRGDLKPPLTFDQLDAQTLVPAMFRG